MQGGFFFSKLINVHALLFGALEYILFDIFIDTCILFSAMGFLGPEDTVFSQLKVERDGRSNVKAQNYATSIEKVRNESYFRLKK